MLLDLYDKYREKIWLNSDGLIHSPYIKENMRKESHHDMFDSIIFFAVMNCVEHSKFFGVEEPTRNDLFEQLST